MLTTEKGKSGFSNYQLDPRGYQQFHSQYPSYQPAQANPASVYGYQQSYQSYPRCAPANFYAQNYGRAPLTRYSSYAPSAANQDFQFSAGRMFPSQFQAPYSSTQISSSSRQSAPATQFQFGRTFQQPTHFTPASNYSSPANFFSAPTAYGNYNQFSQSQFRSSSSMIGGVHSYSHAPFSPAGRYPGFHYPGAQYSASQFRSMPSGYGYSGFGGFGSPFGYPLESLTSRSEPMLALPPAVSMPSPPPPPREPEGEEEEKEKQFQEFVKESPVQRKSEPAIFDGDFDLEYSRKLAAKPVIGEEQD